MAKNSPTATQSAVLAATLLLYASLGARPARAQITSGVGLPAQGAPAPAGPVTPGLPLPVNPAPVPNQQLAFAGQARAPAVVTKTQISVEVKTQNLNHP